MLRPGSVFAHYQIEAVAGSGGMGVVYRAHDLRLDRQVALKIIAPQYARDARVRERLNREATVAAAVSHPNVVPVYEAGEEDETAYIATRWIDGVTLRQLVDREGPLAPARAQRILVEVAGALDAAHETGLIHRDVTPANVMIGLDDEAYLTDFGLTRRTTDVTGLTATGQLMATLDYVAPEQIEGKPVDRRADVYSLGCLGYFLLTGGPPYPRDGHAAKLYAHLAAEYEPVALRRDDVPPVFDDALRAAMAKDPDDRPATAAAFARRLDGVELPDEPVAAAPAAARPAARPDRPRRWRGRIEAGVGVLAAIVLVAAGGGLFLLLRDHGAGTETLHVGRAAASISATPERVLVAGGRSGTVTRLTGDKRRVVVVGGDADHAQENAGHLFVAGGRTLTVLDDRSPTNDRRIRLPGDVAALSTDRRIAWLALRDRPTLMRVGQTATPIPLPHPAAAVQAAGDTLWVADPQSRALLRFDAATGRSLGRPVPVRGRPVALAAGGATLWVVDTQRKALLRLDARTGEASGPPVPVGGTPVAVAADGREAWVVSAGRNIVTRVDARTGRPVDEVGVARGPRSVALTTQAAWVVSTRGALTRIRR